MKNSNLPRYEDLQIKDYYIVHFDFRIKKYLVYKYLRKKTLSVKYMWLHIGIKDNAFLELVYSGYAPHIGIYSDIIEKHKLPPKRVHQLITLSE